MMPRRLGISAGVVVAICLLALTAPWLPLPDPARMQLTAKFMLPTLSHPLGLDELGRDVLSRVVWGARASLFVALASASLGCILGTTLGVCAGFMGGIPRLLTMRGIDVLLCFPPMLLTLLVVTIAGPGPLTLVPILAIVFVPGFTRVAYASVLTIRSLEYVSAMQVLGAGTTRTILRTVLPNIAGPVLVQTSLTLSTALLLESGLSFLGLGVVPPTPSWGLMIGVARETMAQAPWLLLWPCLALTVTVLALNTLCDALRDCFDPHASTVVARVSRALPPAPPLGSGVNEAPVLEVRDLCLELALPHRSGGTPVEAVRDISFSVEARETVAIVGESGSGKSLTALALLGLLPGVARVSSGAVWLQGQELLRLPEKERCRHRGSSISMVFQSPMSSLNPLHPVGYQIAEAILVYQPVGRAKAHAQAIELLHEVGVPDPAQRARSYPHELSGGMRQRVMIAIALANQPRVLIADEPTTSLDVTVQAQVLALLARLRRTKQLSLVFVTHSLPVVAEIADRVIVLYAGEIVEQGNVSAVFSQPLHPYTQALLASAPMEDGPMPVGIPGSVPEPGLRPPGCTFAPRCGIRLDACKQSRPPLVIAIAERRTRCIRWEFLQQTPQTVRS